MKEIIKIKHGASEFIKSKHGASCASDVIQDFMKIKHGASRASEVPQEFIKIKHSASRESHQSRASDMLQELIKNKHGASRASEVTRPGNYRIVFQLWIGVHGEVQHSRLLSSSGDVRRDDHLIDALRVLRVPQAPPTSLSQPLTILILPEAEDSGSGINCQRFEGIS